MDEYMFGACDILLEKILVEGTSVLAEILSLSDHIPSDFKDPTKSKFRQFILDFSYFAKAQEYERQVTNNESLQDVFYATHGQLFSRFEQLFQSIASFINVFTEYTNSVTTDRRKNELLNQTHELEIECLYTLGLIIMYIEKFIPGLVRERLFVVIFRNSDERNNVEFLVDFLRVLEGNDTLFKRAFNNSKFVDSCILMLQSETYEIASKVSLDFKRRRAEKLFVILNFDVALLHGNSTRMRHIVDNFFREQWVLCLGFGVIVNVVDAWQPFKAASTAISNVITVTRAVELATHHYNTLVDVSIPQGPLEPCHFSEYMKIIQDYNNSMKWLVLHSYEKCGRKGDQILQKMPPALKFEKSALSVVLKIAKFEMEFIKTYRTFLQERETKIKETKTECAKLLTELSSFFAHGFTSLKVDKKENLNNWLQLLKNAVENIKEDAVSESVEVANQIKKRIAQVGTMLDLRGNYAISQYLEKIGSQLDSLGALFVLSPEILRSVEVSADCDYLWPLIDEWTARVQERLLSSSNAHPVRVIFHKLGLSLNVLSATITYSEGLNEAVRRIATCLSYYLERRLKNILQSVPCHLFTIMKDIVQPSLKLKFNPILDKTETKALADFEENFRLADATYTISNMSVGISRMSLKKVGTIDVNPKALLEDGIRKELSKTLKELLLIKQKDPLLTATKVVTDVLTNTGEAISNLKNAFIYACDHMDVNGQKMWREEIEEHCQDVLDERLTRTTEIRRKSSIGQPTLDYVISCAYKLTNPSTSKHQPNDNLWINLKSKTESFSSQHVQAIDKMFPAHGLRVIDLLLASDLKDTLNESAALWNSTVSASGSIDLDSDPDVFKSAQLNKISRAIQSNSTVLCEITAKIGQIVLLRKLVNEGRRSEAMKSAPTVMKSVLRLDRTLADQISKDPSSLSDSAFIVNELVKGLGLQDVEKVPIMITKSTQDLALPLFLLYLNQLPKLRGKWPPVCISSLVNGTRFTLTQTDQNRQVENFISWARLHEAFTSTLPKKKRTPSLNDLTQDGFNVSLFTSLVTC